MKITTKSGDDGFTKIYDSNRGKYIRVPKNSLIIQKIGAIDEISSMIGYSIYHCNDEDNIEKLTKLQVFLYEFMSDLGGGRVFHVDEALEIVEKWIEELEDVVNISVFVYPSHYLHVVRTKVRQLEYSFIGSKFLPFINRLSDLLFLMAMVEEGNGIRKVKDNG